MGRASISDPQTSLHESVKISGHLVPAAYFLFASKVLPVEAINRAKQKYGRVLVGFDAGFIPVAGEISVQSFKVARDLGAELEIYVEGPGGETGTTGWDPGEAARVKVAAQSVGIDTAVPGWRAQAWDAGGWIKYTFTQLENYARQGFNAAEIDNIGRVIQGQDKLVAFYRQYANRHEAGTFPQLVMKNLSAPDLNRVIKAVQNGELPRAMFSEFHLSENGTGNDWHKLDQITKQIGIRTVPSYNTYDYAAKGEFGLQTEFDTSYAQTEKGAALVSGTI